MLTDLLTFNFKGEGVAERLIRACQEQAHQCENIRSMVWQTALDNYSAQNVYHRFGLKPKQCIDYELVLFEKKLL